MYSGMSDNIAQQGLIDVEFALQWLKLPTLLISPRARVDADLIQALVDLALCRSSVTNKVALYSQSGYPSPRPPIGLTKNCGSPNRASGFGVWRAWYESIKRFERFIPHGPC